MATHNKRRLLMIEFAYADNATKFVFSSKLLPCNVSRKMRLSGIIHLLDIQHTSFTSSFSSTVALLSDAISDKG